MHQSISLKFCFIFLLYSILYFSCVLHANPSCTVVSSPIHLVYNLNILQPVSNSVVAWL